MEITVNVRHLEFNHEVKNFAASAIEAAFGEFRLKISRADMVLDMQRNLVTASLSVAIKDCPVSSSSAAYDNVYKAIEEAIEKAATQARKYLDKKQDHKKNESLRESEVEKADEE